MDTGDAMDRNKSKSKEKRHSRYWGRQEKILWTTENAKGTVRK